jgi:hypothetical protein
MCKLASGEVPNPGGTPKDVSHIQLGYFEVNTKVFRSYNLVSYLIDSLILLYYAIQKDISA